MSFIKVEAVRAIKLHGKTYRSAHQAALAYADAATGQFYYNCHQKGSVQPMPYIQYKAWAQPIKEKFYRRSHKIFDRYFNGG